MDRYVHVLIRLNGDLMLTQPKTSPLLMVCARAPGYNIIMDHITEV
jgi:hypothetical protein